MLQDVIQSLVHAGIAIDLDPAVAFPSIGIQVDAEGKVFEVGGEATVFAGKRAATVSLPDISTLWTGDRTPPPFPRGPTPEYFAFFMLIERTASDFCSTGRRIVTDKEFERLYDLLRRRPDGDDPEPLSTCRPPFAWSRRCGT